MPITRPITKLTGSEFFQPALPIYLNRISESFYMSEHAHDFIEINWVSEGNGTHHVEGQSLPVAAGDIFFLPVGASHIYRPASTTKRNPLVVYNCLLSPGAFNAAASAFPGFTALAPLLAETQWFHVRDRYGEFRNIFMALYGEYTTDRTGREAALYAGVTQLLLFLLRHKNGREEAASPPLSKEVEKAIHKLHSDYAEPLTLSHIAASCGVSERHFQRLFGKHTGTTFNDYLQNVRIQEACRLLRTTARKISDIAPLVGYQDIPFFNRVFKRKTGVSPREYRRRYDLQS